MRVVYYNSLEEKKKLLLTANKLGETMMQDFYINTDGKHTDGKSGKLTFDKRVDVIDPDFIRKKELTQKLKITDLTIIELNELVRLERRGL